MQVSCFDPAALGIRGRTRCNTLRRPTCALIVQLHRSWSHATVSSRITDRGSAWLGIVRNLDADDLCGGIRGRVIGVVRVVERLGHAELRRDELRIYRAAGAERVEERPRTAAAALACVVNALNVQRFDGEALGEGDGEGEAMPLNIDFCASIENSVPVPLLLGLNENC